MKNTPPKSEHSLSLRKQLQENSYVLVKNTVSKEKTDRVLENTLALLSSFSTIPKGLADSKKPWEEEAFHTAMGDLRKESPEIFGALYDAAQSSVVLDNLLTDDNLLTTVASLLDVPVTSLSSSGHIQRMDAPEDSRNLYDWHQERSYYPQNRDGVNGLAVWIPLLPVSLRGGALKVARGSHKKGYIQINSKQESSLHSRQYAIPEEMVKEYEEVSFPVGVGDALIMYMTTMHKSGLNLTDKFRFVVIGRYHISTAKDFTPYRYTYFHNESVRERLRKEGYDISDLK